MEIVGLKQKVDNDVNKLIFKFVGVKPHPLAELINESKGYWLKTWGTFHEAHNENDGFSFKNWLTYGAKQKLERMVNHVAKEIKIMRPINNRREEFSKLRPWLRRFLFWEFSKKDDYPFPDNGKNRKFIEEQIVELKMKRTPPINRGMSSCSFEW